MKKLGIHARLIIAVVVLISATTLLLGYMGVNITRDYMQTRFEERIRFLAQNLASDAELGILIGDKRMLERLSNNLLDEKDIIRIKIYDQGNEILTEVFKPIVGSLNAIEVPVTLERHHEDSQVFQLEDEVTFLQREPIGSVQITFTTEGISNLINNMKVRFFWLAVELTLLFVIIFYFISRSLVAPISQLALTARKVAKGNHDVRALPGGLPETSELSVAFNAMLDSLEWSNRALEQAYQEMMQQKTLAEMGKFSMIIAHEVKNPLSIIKSSFDLLKKDFPNGHDETLITYVDDEIKRLNRLIEDFLAFAHPVTPLFRKVDLNAMALDIVARHRFKQTPPSTTWLSNIPSEPCTAFADQDLLIRAIDNILKNAAEANGDNGSIYIDASCNPNGWRLEIRDEGSGIGEEDLEHIFEPFYSRRSSGTGLGLAYTHQIIEAHSGRIQASNSDKGGALFTLWIPLREESE